jgi:hypothetical protein
MYNTAKQTNDKVEDNTGTTSSMIYITLGLALCRLFDYRSFRRNTWVLTSPKLVIRLWYPDKNPSIPRWVKSGPPHP